MIYSCGVFEISRQAYYKQVHRIKQKQIYSEYVISKVQDIRVNIPKLGTRKLYYLLGQSLDIGRDKLFRILRANNMLIKPVRSYTKTTMSKH